jgi:peptidylprolyl isomerase
MNGISKMFFTVSVLTATVMVSCGPEKADEQLGNKNNPVKVEQAVLKSAPVPFDVTGKDTITLPDGLKIILVNEGNGMRATAGKIVSVHYTGYLTDGTKFDSSVDKGTPIKFTLGTGQVIKGWDEGIALLTAGSKARLVIPDDMGYGAEGYPPLIPPGATLIFDVELVTVE